MWKKTRAKKPYGVFKKNYFLGLIFIILIFILFITKLNIFTIKQVEIRGDDPCIDKDQLKTTANLLAQNYFFINTSQVESSLKEKFICINSINFIKIFPDKINLQIYFRQPVAVLTTLKEEINLPESLEEDISTAAAQLAKDSYLIDREGIVYKKGTSDLSLPQIIIDDQKINYGEKMKDKYLKVFEILDKIKTFGVVFNKCRIYKEYLIINPDELNPKIIFRLDNQINIQLASLQLILSEAKINRRTIPSSDGINRGTILPKGGRNPGTVSLEGEKELKEIEFIDVRFDKPVVKFAPQKK